MATTFVTNTVAALGPALDLIEQAGATVRLVNEDEYRTILDGADADTVGVEAKGVVTKVSDFVVASGNADAGDMKVLIKNSDNLAEDDYVKLTIGDDMDVLRLDGADLKIKEGKQETYRDLSTRVVPGAHLQHRGQWYRVTHLTNLEVGDVDVLAFELTVGRQGR